jgi:SAM-dependent methyltransferase
MDNFVFNNRKYKYFKHAYNGTWANERAIEIPIFLNIVDFYKGKNILEVGNVLSHYKKFKHDIVDLDEKAEGVINEDVRTFKTSKNYDLIISISTLEHIDETEGGNEQGILDAIENMKSLLAPFGDIYVTLPIAPNEHLNNLLKNKKLGLKEIYYMKKDFFDDYKFNNNIWEQCEFSDIHTFEPCLDGAVLVNNGYVCTKGPKVIYLAIGRI